MKYFKIIKRETKKGINLKVKFANRQHPFGFKELEGSIQAEDEKQAAAILKAILMNALVRKGFRDNNSP
jgi:hypothetical protein